MVVPTMYLVGLVSGGLLSYYRPFPASMAIMVMVWMIGIALHAVNSAAFCQPLGTTFILFGVGIFLGQIFRKTMANKPAGH